MTPMYPTKLLSETWSATSNSPLHSGTVEYHRNEQLNEGQQIVMKTENLQVENKCESDYEQDYFSRIHASVAQLASAFGC